VQLLDGQHIASLIKSEIANEISEIIKCGKRPPHLAIIQVGNDIQNDIYIRNKIKSCKQVGIVAAKITFDASITESQLLAQINALNNDSHIDGFIVQLPLPEHINEQIIIQAIDYRKDVDGFHPMNIGKLVLGEPYLYPATPLGIQELLTRYQIPTEGKHIVIIGRSNIVGKPIANMLIQKNMYGNATVTICHSFTHDLRKICLSADIIIVAVGIPRFLTADMVTNGAVVIDVGNTRIVDATSPRGYYMCGDVDFDMVAPKCSYITPVPGGVGPMTITSLLHNTLEVYKHNKV